MDSARNPRDDEPDVYENKQDFKLDEICPACLMHMNEGHQYQRTHQVYHAIHYLIIEILFDYNEQLWMQLADDDRYDIMIRFLRLTISMRQFDPDLSRDQIITELILSGMFDDLYDDIRDIFERYPDIAVQIVDPQEKILQICVHLFYMNI